MAGYLRRYVNKYRVLADYNKSTNDYPRDQDGNIDDSFDDIYISCSYGIRIYAYGKGILVGYIPSISRGRNILKLIYKEFIGDFSKFYSTKTCDGITRTEFDYTLMCSYLINDKIIWDIEETDEEILFKFNAENIVSFAQILKAKIGGASISPFSTKNLPKTKYTIPLEDLRLYKEIIKDISKDDILILFNITKRFLNEKVAKKLRNNVKLDMKLKGLKGKEYIHSIGLWNEYLLYLKKELSHDESTRKSI